MQTLKDKTCSYRNTGNKLILHLYHSDIKHVIAEL